MFPHHSDQMSQRSQVSRVTQNESSLCQSVSQSVSDNSPIELFWTAENGKEQRKGKMFYLMGGWIGRFNGWVGTE